MVFGTAFLGIKAVEYTQEYHEKLIPGWNFQVPQQDASEVSAQQIDVGRMKMFFVLYFFMTGLACDSPDHRDRPGGGDGLAVVEAVVFRRRCGSDRGGRVVLALCRRRLGVPLSAALLDRRTPMKQHVSTIRTNVMIFVILLLLLLATVGAAYLPLGPLHFPVAMMFAAIKGILIVLFFMHALYSHRLTLVIGIASLLWLSIMIALTLADYHSRGWLNIPGK